MKTHLTLPVCAFLLSASALAQAQVATPATPAATAPAALPPNAAPVLPNGLTVFNGAPYWIWNGRILAVNNTLIPNGQVLTTEGKFVPLPAGVVFPAAVGPEPTSDATVPRGTDQNTVRGVVGPSTVAPTAVKGTDQQTIIGSGGKPSGTNVTGNGGLRRD